MSIPPLVCNTPPPPDQCEEETEDFDLHYTLSQEDDDESEFDFQGYSSYNDVHSHSIYNIGQEEISKSISAKEEVLQNDIVLAVVEKTVNVSEEINVEDLNLSVQKEDVTSSNIEHTILDKDIIENNAERKENINSTDIEIARNDLIITKIESNNHEETSNTDPLINRNKENPPNLPDIHNDSEDYNLDQDCNIREFDVGNKSPCESDTKNDCSNGTEIKSQINEDFDDFKDFQVLTNDASADFVINSENPWQQAETTDNLEICDFKANFDDHIDDDNEEMLNTLNDDEFGDFDEFKSSNAVEISEDPKISSEVPADQVHFLNSHIQIENVNKVFNSIFESEAPITEIVIETNLDSSLGETWRHLLDTDERQPYMVAWNESCGQKALLKALCIDSRNILFTPKWNSNTPKFAANLSNAPLQPQKQSSLSSDVADKQSNKLMSSWTDPFSADGKQSCKPDKEATGTESRPNNDLFIPGSSKSDEIFSSTLNIQPIRQINLPDTHIFTPTDSETPRSKTIHYSSGPPILHPQSSSETNNISLSKETAEPDSEGNGYWEFQDFKGASESNVTFKPISSSSLPTDTTTTVGSQILQPVKVDMLMPTLNWPNPGEIKETFDDFTDFISNTSNTEQNDISKTVAHTTSFTAVTTKTDTETSVTPTAVAANHTNTNIPPGDGFDDFDTFQSALPSKTQSTSTAINTAPQISSNIDYGFFNKSEKTLTYNISNESTRPNNALNKPNNSFSEKTLLPMQATEIPVVPSSILQPTLTNLNTSNQKTGQILQPLSLESYSQINWPNPGIDLQDLSRFNPVDTLHSLKSDLSAGTPSKGASPVHNHKVVPNQSQEDDVWGEFVSSKPKPLPNTASTAVADDDDWSDFISSPNMKTQNGVNTISFNVHTNTNLQKPGNKVINSNDAFDIPTLNYITPKSGSSKTYNLDRHLQRL